MAEIDYLLILTYLYCCVYGWKGSFVEVCIYQYQYICEKTDTWCVVCSVCCGIAYWFESLFVYHDFVKLLLCYRLSIRGFDVVEPYVVYMLYYGAWIEYICLLSFVYIQVSNIVFVVCGWLYRHVTLQKWHNAFSNEIRRNKRIWFKSKKLYRSTWVPSYTCMYVY